MPSFGCYCGKSINLRPIPSPDTAYLLSEATLFELRDQGGDIDVADSRLREFVECPKCGRLHEIGHGGDAKTTYAPQSSGCETGTGWYGVRCIFEFLKNEYEERVTVWQAVSFEDAIAKAEAEAHEYVEDTGVLGYVGLAQAYFIGNDALAEGSEVYSLIRKSPLDPQDYVTAMFDTGHERESTLSEPA